jgi:hypothetical protein
VLDEGVKQDVPVVLSEFGGIALSAERGTWGYSRVATAEELATRYEELMQAIHTIGLLSGFCYTQFADTYQECNGLLHANRTPKFSLERLRTATRGKVRPPEPPSLLADAISPAGPEHAQALNEQG